MSPEDRNAVLLVSADFALIEALKPPLEAGGAGVETAMSPEAAFEALARKPMLVLLDVEWPGMPPGQFMAAATGLGCAPNLPVALISDAVDEEWLDWLSHGILEDVIPRDPGCPQQAFRVRAALLRRRQLRELEELRKFATANTQTDPLTGVYHRSALLSMLFRETDRVQRLKTSLCLLLFDIDDFGHWNARLGAESCDALLCQVAGRSARVLRSYDLIGRMGEDEFLAVLPGCSMVDAVLLAERLRAEVFAAAFRVVAGETVRLSACFGIASSGGRSPVVVLREAEQALQVAKKAGPESIQCFTQKLGAAPAPVAFLSAASGDELLAW